MISSISPAMLALGASCNLAALSGLVIRTNGEGRSRGTLEPMRGTEGSQHVHGARVAALRIRAAKTQNLICYAMRRRAFDLRGNPSKQSAEKLSLLLASPSCMD